MRKLSLRILVALITVGISLSSSWLLHRLRQPRPAPVEPAPCPTPQPAPHFSPVPAEEEEDAEYPDDRVISPWEISWFIDTHPRAKLKKLWTRLHVKDGEAYSDYSECDKCTTKLDSYDLDSEPGDEVVLKISNGLSEGYRYLVFKAVADSTDRWHLIGHVDEWGKYKEAQDLIVLSGSRMWLVTQGQSASGSGVAFFHNRVFTVSRNRLKEVASYECEGSQSGENGWPTKDFSTRILDIQSAQGETSVKVEFNVDYSSWTGGDKELPLFSKRQLAVFVSSRNSGQFLDKNQSTLTQRELNHIYTVDSMTNADFLKYNLSELLNLAKRGTKAQKNWLKEFLERCDGSAEKQQLQAALAK